MKREEVEKRSIEEANFMLNTKGTVRSVAKQFDVSKATIHRDMSVVIPTVDGELARKVQKLMQENKQERHIRGGIATKLKYKSEIGA